MLLYWNEQRQTIVEKEQKCYWRDYGKIRIILTRCVCIEFSRLWLPIEDCFFFPGTGRASSTQEFLLPVSWKKRKDQKALLAPAVFQVLLAQNNPYATVAYFRVTYFHTFHHVTSSTLTKWMAGEGRREEVRWAGSWCYSSLRGWRAPTFLERIYQTAEKQRHRVEGKLTHIPYFCHVLYMFALSRRCQR